MIDYDPIETTKIIESNINGLLRQRKIRQITGKDFDLILMFSLQLLQRLEASGANHNIRVSA